ncbi:MULTISPECIES: ribosome silencing factor [Reichenbachiella]|uniref:Ribosomal silencing factor RsfS n=1 Tax=Reichenbachiella agariperforans TaxID=156994 RepID=A0A1M6RHL0_REIAG|nr:MULTISPECIES: ribosome silencing factor [Reichenbachiella]MBU2915319.1 ribosome silencing factor [Reichenbachiella agariperforans]RJE70541.1 ribosome silencing factor [Reichenbachiella sp. MSK19-1]SHK31914.1 ribosome-associated protein [Reichenbachiella agariperforans]
MTEVKEAQKSDSLEEVVVQGMQERKASDIVVIDLKNITNSVANYFVICSGTSDTQLEAIAQSVEDEVYKTLKIDPWHKEGRENKEWILLDYADVVVHIFRKDRREFYSLEKLWGDAILTQIED